MSSIRKCLITAAAAVLMGILALFPAFAAETEETVYDVRWDSDEDSLAKVTWEYETAKKRPIWKVRLRRGIGTDEDGLHGKPVTKWIRVDQNYVDFTMVISRTGTGVYYAEVYPEGSDDLEDREETQKEYIVDGDELAEIRKWLKNKQSEDQKKSKVYGWIYGPDGSWKYHFTNGAYAVGWQQIDGQTYYFSTNNLMLTGWQIISNRWYYFDAEKGHLWRNAVTPDGYTVNADGVLCVNGTPADASFQPKNSPKNSEKILTDLTSIKVTCKETKVDANVVRPMKVTSNGKFSVETYEFSQPYEQWQPGVPVTVTCTLCANTGFCFTDTTEVTFNRGRLVSFTGNSVERLLIFTYYPRLVLASPENVFLSDNDVLSWTPVKDAVRYILRVTQDGERLNDIYVTTNSYDFSELAYEPDINVAVVAIARESVRNYYYDSFETKIEDLAKIRINGTVTQNSGSMIYVDQTGSRVAGWAEINGYWYHFTNGRAEKGWFRDDNGAWYYFDSNFHMLTGEINDNGTVYFLNDGSNPNLPLGALIQ